MLDPTEIPVEQMKAIRRRAAYHEAGHAVYHWLGMTPGDLYDIDMRPNGDSVARVNSKNVVTSEVFIRAQLQYDKAFGRALAASGVLFLLLGPAAENAVEGKDSDWLSNLIDEMYVEHDPVPENDGSDIARAIRIAMAAYGEKGKRPWTFIYRVGKWADELVSIPQVWNTVESMAKELQASDYIGSDRAWDIMEAGWGEDARGPIPFFALGRKWRRRLFCSPKQNP
jgi:hypothetical protein